ncbi:MAG: hypothetical protein QXE05_00240 [Nitrososphaeria archaeon]
MTAEAQYVFFIGTDFQDDCIFCEEIKFADPVADNPNPDWLLLIHPVIVKTDNQGKVKKTIKPAYLYIHRDRIAFVHKEPVERAKKLNLIIEKVEQE